MTAVAAAVVPVAAGAAKPRLLFVDDEPAVLEGFAANLRRNFDVVTALGGDAGLERLREGGEFAVVVSDMRMPRMDGATFLTRARALAPDSVRVLLTGQADIEATIQAVNHGQIFRFLTKPCPRDVLRAAIDAAVEQHRLVTAERVLLEQTLRGSIKMLIDVLAITSPAAFGRANHIKTRVLQLAKLLGLGEPWQLEIAALASQLGYIVLPAELCAKLEHGQSLTPGEHNAVARAPAVAEQLLANIPRLEGVRAMLANHLAPPRRKPGSDAATALIEVGAHLLRIGVDIADAEARSRVDQVPPMERLRPRAGTYDPEVFAAAEALFEGAPRFVIKEVTVPNLRVGMRLAEDVRLANGTMLVAHGYEITASFIQRIANFPFGALAGAFKIAVPC